MSAQIATDVIVDTIHYLEQQKKRGVQFLRLDPQLLEDWLHAPEGGARGADHFGETTSKSLISVSQKVAGIPFSVNKTSSIQGVAKKTMNADQLAAFDQLRVRALNCQKCPHLVRFRKQVVFGVGNLNAELMFVGEAPGADEDQQGEPFVGRAGQLLTKMIQAMGFTRADVYIANVLKCRPNVETPSGNRKPTPEEMATCIPYLKEQIQLIRPKVLVAVGDTAVKGLIPSLKEGISKLRGHWLEFEGIPLMPTFHPSYLLRNQSLALKRQCWEDLLAVMEKLEKPISEKQHNYFLSAISSKA